jgi:pimeloyl-ACP methyl ester carboxylesterase
LRRYRADGPSACGGPATIDGLVGAPSATHPDVYADTSPAALLPIGAQQAIVSGSRDAIVPAAFGRDYAAKAQAAGDDVHAIEIDGAGHFDLIDPASPAWREIVPLVDGLGN